LINGEAAGLRVGAERTTPAVIDSEQRWRELVERSPVAVAVVGPDARFVYANAQALTLYEADGPDALTGRPALEFVAAADRDAAARLFDSVLRRGRSVLSHRSTLRTLRGSLLTVEISAAPLSQFEQPSLQLELRDVTAQAAAEQALQISERRFRTVFGDSPVAMGLSDEFGRWVETNAAMGQLMGVDARELIDRVATDFAHPDDHHLIASSEQGQQDSPDGVLRMEVRFVRPNGDLRWAWLSITPTPGPAGENWTLCIAQDVTARKAAETALRESKADLDALARVARCVQSGDDPRPVVVSAVRDLSSASTVSMVEALHDGVLIVTANVGIDVLGLTVPLDDVSMTAHVWRTGRQMFLTDAAEHPLVNPALLALDEAVSVLWQPVIVQGTVVAILNVTWRRRIVDPGDRAVRVVGVIADEAGYSLHASRLRRELERSATTDPLTGSLNRRAWDAGLRLLMDRARLSGATLTVALVDLDHFKHYNDAHGHTAGDVLLTEFAGAARTCLRKHDVFARWGGEEFIVALYDCTPDHAEQILDRIRGSMPSGSTCSIGHTTWDGTEPLAASISRADTALYVAKRTGRDRVVGRQDRS
jgi:diguanylate cyclase (GGDEF)-like protein/PAS domain S-box-containing protein